MNMNWGRSGLSAEVVSGSTWEMLSGKPSQADVPKRLVHLTVVTPVALTWEMQDEPLTYRE